MISNKKKAQLVKMTEDLFPSASLAWGTSVWLHELSSWSEPGGEFLHMLSICVGGKWASIKTKCSNCQSGEVVSYVKDAPLSVGKQKQG